MFSKFDEEAQKILIMSKSEMSKLKHPYVGSEHLLLSILKNNISVTDYLNSVGLTYDKFKDEVIRVIGVGSNTNNWFLFTPLLKRVIENAILDSKQSNDKVTVEKLFVSLLEEGEGVANRILLGMNIDIDLLYENYINKFSFISRSSKKNLSIDKYSIDFNQLAKDGKLDKVIGRDKLINRVIEILLRRNKNNPLLIGEAGVGKTAIVEELARRIEKKEVPKELFNKRILSISMASLVSGTKYRGEFEERINKIIEEVESDRNIILFIDEIHTIVGAGGAEGAIDASNILKPYLARGKIKLIGATTKEEYSKYLEEDRALDRRFQKVFVEESTIAETENILFNIKESYEDFHGIKIRDEIIKEIVRLSDKYVSRGKEPDKSIDILDCACTKTVMIDNKYEKEIKLLTSKLTEVVSSKNISIINHDFKKASSLKNQELQLEDKINNLEMKLGCKNIKKEITKEILYDVIYDKTKIPIKSIRNLNKEKIKHNLCKKIIGQEDVISDILDITINKVNKLLPTSILLVGKSGLGKTFFLFDYAKELYNSDAFIKIDMSEYRDSGSISKILGSSPGYVGYNDKSNVLEKVKFNPYSVILLDEIEKAHPSILKLFLQVLDDGYMTNSKGEKIDFRNSIIFMTSNLGCEKSSIGFVDRNYSLVLEKIKNFLGIELVNRLDKVILFKDFNSRSIEKIIRFKLKKFCEVNDLNINYLDYVSKIKKECNYYSEGARGIDRVINRLLGTKLNV